MIFFFASNKLNKVHMNIKLLVWFIWNDFKFVFFYHEVRVKNGSICHVAKTIKSQGRDVGNCTQCGWAKGSYSVVGGPNKVSCKNINVYAQHTYMHYFPREEAVRQKWIRFVRKHRKDFVPSKSSTLWTVCYYAQTYMLAVVDPAY